MNLLCTVCVNNWHKFMHSVEILINYVIYICSHLNLLADWTELSGSLNCGSTHTHTSTCHLVVQPTSLNEFFHSISSEISFQSTPPCFMFIHYNRSISLYDWVTNLTSWLHFLFISYQMLWMILNKYLLWKKLFFTCNQ